ncbi:MAG: pyridoxal phosphate-dependent aminotransferase [Sandaracinaceae bacterium]
MFSARSGERAGELNALTRALRARRRAGQPLLDLTLTNPTRAELPYDPDALASALARGARGGYDPQPRGLRSAREAVAARHAALGDRVDPDRVVLTASTSEAYGYLLTLLADPGDAVLAPEPTYPLLPHLAALASVRLRPYAMRYDGRWLPDAPEVFEAIDERTRAIIGVSPANPTGAILGPEEREGLAAFGLPLVLDEVFAAFPLEAASGVVSGGPPAGVLSFRLGGLSKLAGLPQHKLAWILVDGPEPQVAAALERLDLIADTYLSVATPVQRALPELLAATEAVRGAIRARCRRHLDELRSLLTGTTATVPRVEGGWVAPLRVPATRSDEEWALACLEAGVLVHPGYFYDFPPDEAWLVVSLLTPPPAFQAGVERIAEVLDSAGGDGKRRRDGVG